MMKKLEDYLRGQVLLLYVTGQRKLRERKGQGTTEYAILVGILVVIAIIAVVAFRDRIQGLWEGIRDSINSLTVPSR
ncbi:MAG: class III signal peptide-containing protein [Coriobacteriales bacterium]|nr:class III signal peptide-containing protein [Coriobacteriales bacterium]